MGNKKNLKIVSLALAVLMSLLVLSGCGGAAQNNGSGENGTTAAGTEKNGEKGAGLPLLEYSWCPRGGDPSIVQKMQTYAPKDVVTPYIEEKFKIRLNKDIIQAPKDMPTEQAVAMWIAADNLPDVIEVSNSGLALLAKTGKFADLTEYAKAMPNYQKYYEQKYWNWSAIDGKQYGIGGIGSIYPPTLANDDPYLAGAFAHGLWVREDILTKCGYSFTPVEELKKSTTAAGVKPTMEQMAITPAIATPDDLYDLLKKIKALDIKVNGKPMIPMSFISWEQFHIGSMFDFGHWRIDANGNVDGYLGLPGAEDYYSFLVKLYREGLLDPDFILQKDQEYQDKVASGRVALGFWAMPDFYGAKDTLLKTDPVARIRFIPFPKADEDLGFYDLINPQPFYFALIRGNMPAENITRLTQYWDWLFSDEGQDLISWGPESSGLWEIKDGKKVFKDPAVEKDMLSLTRNANGPDTYGLTYGRDSTFSYSPVVLAAPIVPDYKQYQRGYPPNIDIDEIMKNMLGINGINLDMTASYGDNSQLLSDLSSWYWSEFVAKDVAKLLKTKTDAEFSTAWEQIMKAFKETTKYDEAQKAMVEWFKAHPAEQ